MNQLVFIQDDDVLTDTLTIAEIFNKRHDLVLRDVRKTFLSLDELANRKEVKDLGIDISSLKFEETRYTHEQNNQNYPMYLLNFDAFMLVTMSYTTENAMLIKIKYMNRFNEMRDQLSKPKVLSEKEQLKASMKLTLEANETLEEHNERISELENNMRIDGVQERKLQNKGNHVVLESLSGKESPAYKEISRKAFSAMWRDFKNHFMIPRFSELPKVQFEEGLRFVGMWQPSTSLKIEIDNLNRQQTMKEVV